MIPVIDLVRSLRFALRDMQAVKISDYELIEVINQAASFLYSQLSEKFVPYGVKRKILITDSSGSTGLPSDFVKIHQVGMGNNVVAVPSSYTPTTSGTYRIVGDVFYAPEGIYTFEYYYVPSRVSALSDTLDAPLAIAPYIKDIALSLYGNNTEKAQQTVQICIAALTAREVSHFQDIGPVQILGGRI